MGYRREHARDFTFLMRSIITATLLLADFPLTFLQISRFHLTMIVTTIALLLTPLASICEGFAVPMQRHPGNKFVRNLPTLYFQEDDTIIATPPTKDLVSALLEGEIVPLLGSDTDLFHDGDDALHLFHDDSEVVAPYPKTMLSLRPLSFDDDIAGFLDIARPYYALGNEHAIVNEETGEIIGLLCTCRAEMPIGCESGGITWADAGRHMAAAGTVAALLQNPQKKR